MTDQQQRMHKVLNDVAVERQRQCDKWGESCDFNKDLFTFIENIQDYAVWARVNGRMGNDKGRTTMRRRLMQTAALAVAAVEELDRRMAFPQV